MKIGVMVESFRAGLDGGLAAAAELGADGVQMYATGSEVSPEALDGTARKDLTKRLADMGLEFSAICADLGGHGFQIADDNSRRIEATKRVLDLTLDLGCTVATAHIGVVPADKAHPRYAVMARACEELGRHAQGAGGTFAIETGPEPSAVLRAFLDDIGLPGGLGVNFDPANLAMVIAEDIPAAVERLGPYIVHTHAKDGKNLQPVDAEKLYGAFAGDVPEGFKWDEYICEVPLGQGDVPWAEYLAALGKVGFDGYLTIEREVGEKPRADVELAVGFLRDLLN